MSSDSNLKDVFPAVVKIQNNTRHFDPFTGKFQPGSSGQGTGTGFIIESSSKNPDTYMILTCYHVIANADEDGILVQTPYLGTNKFKFKVHAVNPENDLATIKGSFVGKEEIARKVLKKIKLRNDNVISASDSVCAVGYPMGMRDPKVTCGIFAGYASEVMRLQIGAPIAPGYSGGPVVDSKGNLVGLIDKKMSGNHAEGVGFCVGLDMIRLMVPMFQNHKESKVQRTPMFGFCVRDADSVTQKLVKKTSNQDHSVVVSSVMPNSPASEADLRKGDVILSLSFVGEDGKPYSFTVDHPDAQVSAGNFHLGSRVNGSVPFSDVLMRVPTTTVVVIKGMRMDYGELNPTRLSGGDTGNAYHVSVPAKPQQWTMQRKNFMSGMNLTTYPDLEPGHWDYVNILGMTFSPMRTNLLQNSGTMGAAQNPAIVMSFMKFEEHERFQDRVMITKVANNSEASRHGIHVGCVVEKVNGQDVHTISDLRSALSKPHGKAVIMIDCWGMGSTKTFVTDVKDALDFEKVLKRQNFYDSDKTILKSWELPIDA